MYVSFPFAQSGANQRRCSATAGKITVFMPAHTYMPPNVIARHPVDVDNDDGGRKLSSACIPGRDTGLPPPSLSRPRVYEWNVQ